MATHSESDKAATVEFFNPILYGAVGTVRQSLTSHSGTWVSDLESMAGGGEGSDASSESRCSGTAGDVGRQGAGVRRRENQMLVGFPRKRERQLKKRVVSCALFLSPLLALGACYQLAIPESLFRGEAGSGSEGVEPDEGSVPLPTDFGSGTDRNAIAEPPPQSATVAAISAGVAALAGGAGVWLCCCSDTREWFVHELKMTVGVPMPTRESEGTWRDRVALVSRACDAEAFWKDHATEIGEKMLENYVSSLKDKGPRPGDLSEVLGQDGTSIAEYFRFNMPKRLGATTIRKGRDRAIDKRKAEFLTRGHGLRTYSTLPYTKLGVETTLPYFHRRDFPPVDIWEASETHNIRTEVLSVKIPVGVFARNSEEALSWFRLWRDAIQHSDNRFGRTHKAGSTADALYSGDLLVSTTLRAGDAFNFVDGNWHAEVW